MYTAIFSKAVVPASNTPRHHISAAFIPGISLQLLVSSNIRSLPRKWHSQTAEEWRMFCSHFHAAHLKWRSLPAPKIYFLLTSFSWSCKRRKVFRMTSKSHHNGWIPLTIKKEGRQHCEDSKSCRCNFCHLRSSKKFKRGLRLFWVVHRPFCSSLNLSHKVFEK